MNPSGNEAIFDINELFFSITTHDSKIVSGNEVFVRISGYTKDELVGSYHNIVRHPDMPKTVFKIFWDHLKAHKPIAAYVKNKTKEGGYYWVMAVVFPMGNRYVSLRLKPTSRYFEIVKTLYETTYDDETAFELAIHALGYADYDALMHEMVIAELQSRHALVAQHDTHHHRANTDEEKRFNALLDEIFYFKTRYLGWFEGIERFRAMNAVLHEKGMMLERLAMDTMFLSLNASVASFRTALDGGTFGVISQDIRTNVKANDLLVVELDGVAHILSKQLRSVVFSAGAIYLQIEMSAYFIQEILEGVTEADSYTNIALLTTLIEQYVREIDALHRAVEKSVHDVQTILHALEQKVDYLNYVQMYGTIEASSSVGKAAGFEEIFSQFKTLITKTSQELETMQRTMQMFRADNEHLMSISQNMVTRLAVLKQHIASIDEQGVL